MAYQIALKPYLTSPLQVSVHRHIAPCFQSKSAFGLRTPQPRRKQARLGVSAMSRMAGVGSYDPENIFSQILDGKIPAFKIFETEHSLAFLDAFPIVPGHSLLIPKKKGYSTLDEMPAEEAAKFLADLPRLVQTVQSATGCEGVNVCQNNGPAAGQVVFHPHFHVIPRSSATDNLDEPPVKYGHGSKTMLTPEDAKNMLTKMGA